MRFRILFVGVLFLCTLLACGLGGAKTATPMPTAVQSLPEPTTPPEPVQASPAGSFRLTLPDGKAVEASVYKCEGVRAGEFLDVRAASTQDLADPERVEVQIAGAHQGAGQAAGMYVAIWIGPKDAWVFTGNTLAAEFTLEGEGSGRFDDVAIINAAVSAPPYQNGQEYKFSGEWTCTP